MLKIDKTEIELMQKVLFLSIGSQGALDILKKVKDLYPEKFAWVLQQLEAKSIQSQGIVDCFHQNRSNLQLFLGFLEQ